jgi:hypothetical protein
VHERWARLRFSIIGALLAAPPAKGALHAALQQLAAREWRHPSTGAPVRFSISTLERWFSAEEIVLRSGMAGAAQQLLAINRISAPPGTTVSA